MKSIRHRLLLWQTGALLVVTVLVGIIIYSLTLNGFNRTRDFALEQIARTVSRHTSGSGGAATESKNFDPYVTQVWDADGVLRYSSHPELKLPRQTEGFNGVEWLGEEWHVYTLVSGGVTTQVANTAANRSLMFSEITQGLLIPLAVLIGILGSLLWIAVDEAFQPLEAIRREIGGLDIARLHALPLQNYPPEIAPLVDTLNHLLNRLDQVLSTQRRFIADAAHELRTPLTAIGLQTQIALISPVEGDRQNALNMLKTSVDRASRLVAQLLLLARFDPETRSKTTRVRVSLADLVKSAVSEFSTIAEAKGIDLGAGDCASTHVLADADGMRVLLDNLIDNALRYGHAGGRIDVEVIDLGGRVALLVTDDGPGIPDPEKVKVFERFHRLAGANVPGSGLGLAIVNEIAGDHGGLVALIDAPGGGLIVRVELPKNGSDHPGG